MENHDPGDDNLIGRLARHAAGGNLSALDALVGQARARLFALAYADLRHYDDARDAVAAAFLKVCLHIAELRDPDRVLPWMRAIVRNEVRRIRGERTQEGRHTTSFDDREASTVPGGAPFDRAAQLRIDIDRALRLLPQAQEEAIRLFYLLDLPAGEIARRIGDTESAVRQRLHRARRNLADQLKGYEPMTTPPLGPSPTPSESTELDPPIRLAAILHSQLEPPLMARLTTALEAGGYRVSLLTADQLEGFQENLAGLVQLVSSAGRDLLVLDERIGSRTALEYILNLKGPSRERTNIPTCVLRSAKIDYFAGAAYFAAGVDRLLDKSAPAEIERFAQPFRSLQKQGGFRYTRAEHAAIARAAELAKQRGDREIDTGHALLGLLDVETDSETRFSITPFLADTFGIPADAVRSTVERLLPEPGGNTGDGSIPLSTRTKEAIDYASEESALLRKSKSGPASWRLLGIEHMLLGLLREPSGVAGEALRSLGMDLDQARAYLIQRP